MVFSDCFHLLDLLFSGLRRIPRSETRSGGQRDCVSTGNALGAVFIIVTLADNGCSSIFVLEVELPLEAGGTPCQATIDMAIDAPKIQEVDKKAEEKREEG